MLVATKGGLTRHGPDIWAPVGRPEYLRQCVLMSLRRLGVERIDLWQLHRIDAKVPREEQFAVIAAMQKEGLIRHVGLGEVNVEEIEAARKHFSVAIVQNQYNLGNRRSEAVLNLGPRHRFHPVVSAGRRRAGRAGLGADKNCEQARCQQRPGGTGPAAETVAGDVADPGQFQRRAPAENVSAAALTLTDEDFVALEAAAS